MSRHAHLMTAAVLLSLVASPRPARANDAVLEWNQIAATSTLTAAPALAPVQQTRVMAIVQVAVHDAVNGITGNFETYLSHGAAPAGSSADAAAIAAAHAALKGLFTGPGQGEAFDAAYAASLMAHGVLATDPGLGFGQAVAAAILAHRANDGSAAAQFPYTAPGAGTVGVWVALGSQQALLPGWGNVAPFVLKSGSQFRPDPPPALDSEQYAKDYNEVMEIGSASSLVRTQLQTDIALFWRGSPTAIWNNILRAMIVARNFDTSTAARTIALFYLAASDSSVACWDAKYVYNFWRPLPAIINGNIDGNPMTIGDPDWLPLIATPAHPEYPSGHTSNSGAMAHTLALIFGDDPGVPIVATSPTARAGFMRQWETFSEGLDEVIDARIYSGFHYRTADRTGARLGRQVARFVLTHALRPSRGGNTP